ncbi:MAG: hypothetical protein IJA17_01170 [Oscillospiraceae bacterium]|nr:hypothetical protein [Oscillospiraceae bacterium]
MNKRQNAGYIITDTIHIGDTEFVLGEHPKAAAPYVTWECSGNDNYFWGHYFMDRKTAVLDLVERAEKELDFQQKQEKQIKNRSNNRKRGKKR